MKQKTKRAISVYITFTALIVLLTAAECTIGECSITWNDYEAHAVNVKYTDADAYWKDAGSLSLANTSISLYAYNATDGSYSTTAYATTSVATDGSFSFFSPEPNRYKLTGTYDTTANADWIFVPQYVEITNSGASAKDLYAFPASGAGAYTVIASWETTDKDVDLSLTYGPDIDVIATPWTTGNGLAAFDERFHVYYNGPGENDQLYHDTDVRDTAAADVPRVETMSVYSSGWLADNDVIRFYLDVYNDDILTGLEDSEPSSFAQVDLMQGSTHYGTWYIPWNTAENTLEVFYMEYSSGTITVKTAGFADYFKGLDLE
ncbi:MAG TPA: hypothetical protein DCO79_00555 [Spirochaeta sp.]|nr:hypothetical protein [Spirochaeta sp.]